MLIVSVDTLTLLFIVILLEQQFYILLTKSYDLLLIITMFFLDVLTRVMSHYRISSLIKKQSQQFLPLQYSIIIPFDSLPTRTHCLLNHILLHFRGLLFHQPMKFGFLLTLSFILLVPFYHLGLAVTSNITCLRQVL